VLAVTATGWGITIAVLAALIAVDLLLFARRQDAVSLREAAAWSSFYIAVALLFGVVLGLQSGWGLGVEYLTGYAVEKSLSIDNLFVFVVIVATFAVPAAQQPKALTIGIVIALALRFVLIALGAALIDAFSFMFLLFGLLLFATAIQLMRHRDQDPSVEDNVLVGAARRLLPITDRYHGSRLLTRVGTRRALTPMFLVVLAIGSTDVLFALDSIPAVFGITRHAYIVFAANAFALLGLRTLFFLVSGLLDRLVYLSTGLASILAFIGLKLVLHFAHTLDTAVPEIPTVASLLVIVATLAIVTAASLIQTRHRPALRAHAGALREPARDRDAPADAASGAC